MVSATDQFGFRADVQHWTERYRQGYYGAQVGSLFKTFLTFSAMRKIRADGAAVCEGEFGARDPSDRRSSRPGSLQVETG